MRTDKRHFDVVVVGAGAAGQMAAITAGRSGASVILLEQMLKPGMKIFASGGGRCNLTNLSLLEKYEMLFGKQGRFIRYAMQTMLPKDLCKFFDELGVSTRTDKTGLKVFPSSDKSIHVEAALRKEIQRLRVFLTTGWEAVEFLVNDSSIIGVKSKKGDEISCSCTVIACGGKSWPELGGNGGGYRLAQQVGHNIEPLVPALVPLVVENKVTAELAGIALNNAGVFIPGNKKISYGDVLFTHRGVSGPAVLDISGDVAQLLEKQKPVIIHVELVADMRKEQWQDRFENWRNNCGKRKVVNLLAEILPASLCKYLCLISNINDDVTAAQLSADGRKKLVESLCGFKLKIVSTEGFKTAFVTRGGIRLKEVDAKTMRSRSVKNLFFAGEVLNLDGPTGGFNLQWAFASGYLAGKSAADFINHLL